MKSGLYYICARKRVQKGEKVLKKRVIIQPGRKEGLRHEKESDTGLHDGSYCRNSLGIGRFVLDDSHIVRIHCPHGSVYKDIARNSVHGNIHDD